MDVRYSNAEKYDKQSLIDLWLLCFDEKPQAAELFFDNCFQPENSYIAVCDEKIVSALYLVKGSFNGLQAHYLCGAATDPDYRKNGIMGRLIEYALSDAKKRGDVFSFLFPANEGLYNFYSRFGYVKKCFAYVHTADREMLRKISEENLFGDSKSGATDSLVMDRAFIRFASEYYAIYDVKCISNSDFTVFYDEKDGTAEVFTCLCEDNNFPKLCKRLLEASTAEKFKFVLKRKNNLFDNSKKIHHGMMLVLDEKYKNTNDAYIEITLN